MPNANDALDLLSAAIESKMERGMNLNQACVSLVKKLGYKRTTIINMYSRQSVTDRAAKRIIKALKPQRKRFRRHIEFRNQEELDRARELSVEEMREAIDNYIRLKGFQK